MKPFSILCCVFLCGVAFLGVGCKQESKVISPVASVLALDVVSVEEIYLAGQPIALQRIGENLSSRAEQAEVYLVFQVAPDTPMSVYNEVMQQIRGSGISGVADASDNSEQDRRTLNFYLPAIPS